MGAAVGGTNQIDYRGGKSAGGRKKLPAAPEPGACVCVCVRARVFKQLRFQGEFICAFEEKVSRV